jgi:uncharacterized protein
MRVTRLLAAFALVLAPSVAAAQPAVPVPPSRPADAAAAPEVELQLGLELVDALKLREAAIAAVRTAMDQQLESEPELAPYRDVLEGWATDLFRTPEAALEFARVYAETFTEAELRGLLAFYRSPLGRRLVAEQPEIMLRGEEIGERIAEANMDDLMERLDKAMEESGRKPKND